MNEAAAEWRGRRGTPGQQRWSRKIQRKAAGRWRQSIRRSEI